MNWLDSLYNKRFIVFIISLCAILFGNLIFPEKLYQFIISPVFLLINILTGVLLVRKKNKTKVFFIGLLLSILIALMIEFLVPGSEQLMTYIRFSLFFLFYAMVTLEVISQVWRTEQVNETVILGLISGYICLGLLGSFLFMLIEILEPGSFTGITESIESAITRESIMYFSYITLLTIGYGEIVPSSVLARNASVLLGILGQFYMVILTAIVVGKFLTQKFMDGNKSN